MDENRPPYRLHAPRPADSAPSYELPARRGAPRARRRLRVDEHEIRPELERREMIDGEILQTFPAELPHAVQNGDLDYLLRAHLAPGYRVATDLVTRHDWKNDFASDSAVVRDGTDPSTGSRYREELAFEIVSKQNKAKVTRKAPTMLKRGVDRVFAVFVKTGVVAEWVPDAGIKAKGRWVEMAGDAKISHPSLAEPMPVGAILDAASADDTVARALAAKGNPVIREIRAEGEAKGKAEAIVTVLVGRGLPPGDAVRRRILGTTDLATLERWLLKAVTVSSPEEVVED
jgi:hypothetical protein